MTREELEEILGIRVYDWQWERYRDWSSGKTIPHLYHPRVSITKEELTTVRPDMIAVLTDAIKHAKIDQEAEERETP